MDKFTTGRVVRVAFGIHETTTAVVFSTGIGSAIVGKVVGRVIVVADPEVEVDDGYAAAALFHVRLVEHVDVGTTGTGVQVFVDERPALIYVLGLQVVDTGLVFVANHHHIGDVLLCPNTLSEGEKGEENE